MAASKASLTDAGLLVLRIAGAFLAVAHGWGKVSDGFHAMVTEGVEWRFVAGVRDLGFPAPLAFAWAAALAELVGGAAVALGLYTRFAAFAAAFTMFVAAFFRHGGEGFGAMEMALLYLCVMLGLVFTGGGKLTLDSVWRKG